MKKMWGVLRQLQYLTASNPLQTEGCGLVSRTMEQSIYNWQGSRAEAFQYSTLRSFEYQYNLQKDMFRNSMYSSGSLAGSMTLHQPLTFYRRFPDPDAPAGHDRE